MNLISQPLNKKKKKARVEVEFPKKIDEISNKINVQISNNLFSIHTKLTILPLGYLGIFHVSTSTWPPALLDLVHLDQHGRSISTRRRQWWPPILPHRSPSVHNWYFCLFVIKKVLMFHSWVKLRIKLSFPFYMLCYFQCFGSDICFHI